MLEIRGVLGDIFSALSNRAHPALGPTESKFATAFPSLLIGFRALGLRAYRVYSRVS